MGTCVEPDCIGGGPGVFIMNGRTTIKVRDFAQEVNDIDMVVFEGVALPGASNFGSYFYWPFTLYYQTFDCTTNHDCEPLLNEFGQSACKNLPGVIFVWVQRISSTVVRVRAFAMVGGTAVFGIIFDSGEITLACGSTTTSVANTLVEADCDSECVSAKLAIPTYMSPQWVWGWGGTVDLAAYTCASPTITPPCVTPGWDAVGTYDDIEPCCITLPDTDPPTHLIPPECSSTDPGTPPLPPPVPPPHPGPPPVPPPPPPPPTPSGCPETITVSWSSLNDNDAICSGIGGMTSCSPNVSGHTFTKTSDSGGTGGACTYASVSNVCVIGFLCSAEYFWNGSEWLLLIDGGPAILWEGTPGGTPDIANPVPGGGGFLTKTDGCTGGSAFLSTP